MASEDGRLQWIATALLPTLYARSGMACEQYRKMSIRLEVLKETLGGAMKLIVVTSPLMGDGKTITAVNLAVMLSQAEGRRVCLVDCDVRKPRLWAFFRNPPSRGLVDLLLGGARIEDAVLPAEGGALDVLALPRGSDPRIDPMPAERTKAALHDLRERYDFVICDAPPVLPIADTAALARIADGILIVVRANLTPRQAVGHTLNCIDRNKLIGFVLNGVAERSIQKYYYRYRAADDDGRRARKTT